MPVPEITKREVVTPVDRWADDYENLRFCDGDGREYKIAKKRVEKLQDEIVVGEPVELGWAEFTPKDLDEPIEYIAVAHLVSSLSDEVKPPPKGSRPETKTAKKTPDHAPQELGMWWKELGNRIGDGSLAKDYPKANVKIKGQYYKKMSEVTGVDFQ